MANLEDLQRLGARLGHDEESEEGSAYWGYSRRVGAEGERSEGRSGWLFWGDRGLEFW